MTLCCESPQVVNIQILPALDIIVVTEFPKASQIATIAFCRMRRQAPLQLKMLKKPLDEMPLSVMHADGGASADSTCNRLPGQGRGDQFSDSGQKIYAFARVKMIWVTAADGQKANCSIFTQRDQGD